MRRFLSLLVSLSLIISLVPAAFAASDEAATAANKLYELGLFGGTGTDANGNPVFDLDRAPTRHEAITMLVRLLGKTNEAESGTWNTPFTDVADWAKPYVGYAYTNGLAGGTSATTFSGNDTVSASQYLTFVLRALGYESGTDFQWNKAWELSDKIGLTDGRYNASTTNFTRGDVAIVSNYALSTPLKGQSRTLADSLGLNGVVVENNPKTEEIAPSTPATTPPVIVTTPSSTAPEGLTDAQRVQIASKVSSAATNSADGFEILLSAGACYANKTFSTGSTYQKYDAAEKRYLLAAEMSFFQAKADVSSIKSVAEEANNSEIATRCDRFITLCDELSAFSEMDTSAMQTTTTASKEILSLLTEITEIAGTSSQSQAGSSPITNQPSPSEANNGTSYPEGEYRVGIDIPAGQYRMTGTSDIPGYCNIYASIDKSSRPSINQIRGVGYFTLKDGQLISVTRATFELITPSSSN